MFSSEPPVGEWLAIEKYHFFKKIEHDMYIYIYKYKSIYMYTYYVKTIYL